MNEQEIKNSILENSLTPVFIKEALLQNNELNYSIISKERILDVWESRLLSLYNRPEYRTVVTETENLLKNLKETKVETLTMISLITESKYLSLFYDYEMNEFYGVVDFTGRGNTDAFLLRPA